jgi:hypothetical protein
MLLIPKGLLRVTSLISMSSNGKNNRHCTNCDRSGHTVDGCFKKHGYPPHIQRSHGAYNASIEAGESSNVANEVASQQFPTITQLMQLLQSSNINQCSASSFHRVNSSQSFGPSSNDRGGSVSISSSFCCNIGQGSCILDLGASDHIHGSLQCVDSYN